MATFDLSIFKAYDVRGIYPQQINEEIAYRIGRAYTLFTRARKIAVGRDMRLSSPSLTQALIRGLTDQGANVVNLGMISTDMLYFAVPHYQLEGGIMVTASHNPPEWNGLKFIREQAIPISSDSGLKTIAEIALKGEFSSPPTPGSVEELNVYSDYTQHVLKFVHPEKIKPFRIVADPGNGLGGKVADCLFPYLKSQLIRLNWEPDGTFPSHEPNPMLVENQQQCKERVLQERADLGILWDGDADRCFFIDSEGNFVEGYFVTALLAEAMLRKSPGEKILCDPRNIWAVIETVQEKGGIPIVTKGGHSFMKERMRQENAIFGGEMSGHYYFRENYYCDSGFIPVVLLLELMSLKDQSLREMLAPLRAKYFISGEINFQVKDHQKVLKFFEERYPDAEKSYIDGLSIEYPNWRINIRPSNTEPLLRLNVEARSKELMEQIREETSQWIQRLAGEG